MRTALPDGFELDDDRDRVDVDVVHRFLSEEAYWVRGRSRATIAELIRSSTRVIAALCPAEKKRKSRGQAMPPAATTALPRRARCIRLKRNEFIFFAPCNSECGLRFYPQFRNPQSAIRNWKALSD